VLSITPSNHQMQAAALEAIWGDRGLVGTENRQSSVPEGTSSAPRGGARRANPIAAPNEKPARAMRPVAAKPQRDRIRPGRKRGIPRPTARRRRGLKIRPK